jgi:hypothetical protein
MATQGENPQAEQQVEGGQTENLQSEEGSKAETLLALADNGKPENAVSRMDLAAREQGGKYVAPGLNRLNAMQSGTAMG